MLKPQDVLVACKLAVVGPEWTYDRLSASLSLSRAEAHACVRRLDDAGVLRAPAGGGAKLRRREILDLLLAAPKIFCGSLDGKTGRGTPTSISAPPLVGLFEVDASDDPVVWSSSYPEMVEPGQVVGQLLSPLYSTVPRAVRGDQDLWRLLALVDVLRVGEPEQKKKAATVLKEHVVGGK